MNSSDVASQDIDFDSVAGKTYVLASPSVAPINQLAAMHLRVAMMHMSNRGAKWAGDASSSRGSVMAARNQAIDAAFECAAERETEGVLWVDDDLLMPPYAFTAM